MLHGNKFVKSFVEVIGTAYRWSQIVTLRQPYIVPGPTCLWHIGEYLLYHMF